MVIMGKGQAKVFAELAAEQVIANEIADFQLGRTEAERLVARPRRDAHSIDQVISRSIPLGKGTTGPPAVWCLLVREGSRRSVKVLSDRGKW